VSSPPSPSSLLKLPHMMSLARLAIELIYGWLCNNLALIERLKRNSQMGLVFSQSVGDPIQRVVFCFERYHCTAWMLLVTWQNRQRKWHVIRMRNGDNSLKFRHTRDPTRDHVMHSARAVSVENKCLALRGPKNNFFSPYKLWLSQSVHTPGTLLYCRLLYSFYDLVKTKPDEESIKITMLLIACFYVVIPGGGVLPTMAYTGRLRSKGIPFQASGI